MALEEDWAYCTMCRSARQGVSTLHRASLRKVEWPDQPMQSLQVSEEPTIYTSINDAFDTILQYMNVSSQQCKRFYRNQPKGKCSNEDKNHIRRFHQPHYPIHYKRNPLQKSEDVHVEVVPGSYAVTAGRWGAERQHTHVVRIEPGQTVDLAFAI
ncbi:A-kinase-interacting protein 1-like [Actinia tenebrosa]|uniref:A-kinase-interacting protein 1-like n=1 Tax=Actinia tenebrosa TaxID=6105 RepID=A0A6P8IUA9_ACTTE|nr:A-kinase-interacting protein 1-like [Actinia tenebrosa]